MILVPSSIIPDGTIKKKLSSGLKFKLRIWFKFVHYFGKYNLKKNVIIRNKMKFPQLMLKMSPSKVKIKN